MVIIDLGGTQSFSSNIITVNIDQEVNPDFCQDIVKFLNNVVTQDLNHGFLLKTTKTPYNIEFSSKNIEEIRMIHTIEHIRKEYVPDVLNNCYKILRETFGKLVIECPDLTKIAKMILMNDEELKQYLQIWGIFHSKFTREQLTMWGLYGRSDINDAHTHWWAYTASSLITLLKNTGFIKIEEKTRVGGHIPARDIRIEAWT